MTESEIQSEIMNYLEAVILPHQGVVYRSQPSRRRGHHRSESGMPDVILCYRGRWVGLEIKKPKGVKGTKQIEFKARIEKAGGIYEFVHSVDEVKAVIDQLRREG